VLDPEAVRAAEAGGATVAERVRLDDLPRAGWRVKPWVRRADGSAVLDLRRPFSSPAGLRAAMVDLSGTHGPVRNVRLRRGSDPVRTTFRFRALADLAGITAGVVDDRQLAANLSAQRVDVAGLDATLTARLKEALRLHVAISLPGGGTRVWNVAPGTRAVLDRSSSQFDPARAAWFAVGIVLAAATLALVFVGEYKARKRRRLAEPRSGDGV
jgi:hypothetical protein